MRTFPARRALVVVLAAGLATVAGLVAPTPAAANPWLQVVHEAGPFDASPTKSLTVNCPRGTNVIDGGGSHNGGGNVRLTGLRPVGNGFEVTATAQIAGYGSDWQLRAYAICTTMDYQLEVVSTTSTRSDQWWRGLRVTCPGSSKLMGLGAYLNDVHGNPPAGVALHVLLPSENLDYVSASAYRVDDDYRDDWQLTVYAVCAHFAPFELVRVMGIHYWGNPSAWATCPSGTLLFGVGGANNAAPGQLTITTMVPMTNLSGVEFAGAETDPPASTTWKPVAFAICGAG